MSSSTRTSNDAHLDGNAIAGALHDVYGHEMTTATGRCAHCGAVSQLAELHVYLRAPGTVARCSNCENVVLVLVEVRGVNCVDASGLAQLETANGPDSRPAG
jgi:hypothetical protein